MRTKIVNASGAVGYEKPLAEVAQALRDGALVIFPTETVYGVAANATNREAVARLRAVKGRDDGQPFTVHIGRPDEAQNYVDAPSPLLRRFIRRAWPGPLTLVAHTDPLKTKVSQIVPEPLMREIFHENTVGLRCPDHEVAEYILIAAGVPVVASSANKAGLPPPRDMGEALAGLTDEVEHAIDSGRTRFGAASSVVEVNGNQWKLLRTGRIDERTLKRMEKSEIVFVCTGNSCRSPMAEHLFRHALAERLGKSTEQLEAEGHFVSSAGVCAATGAPPSQGAVDVLRRRGINLSAHRSQPVTVELLLAAERVFVMSPEHRSAVLDLAPGIAPKVEMLDPGHPIADPVGMGIETYEECARQIEHAVAKRLEEYANANRDW